MAWNCELAAHAVQAVAWAGVPAPSEQGFCDSHARLPQLSWGEMAVTPPGNFKLHSAKKGRKCPAGVAAQGHHSESLELEHEWPAG